jgi:hypothetical protein
MQSGSKSGNIESIFLDHFFSDIGGQIFSRHILQYSAHLGHSRQMDRTWIVLEQTSSLFRKSYVRYVTRLVDIVSAYVSHAKWMRNYIRGPAPWIALRSINTLLSTTSI